MSLTMCIFYLSIKVTAVLPVESSVEVQRVLELTKKLGEVSERLIKYHADVYTRCNVVRWSKMHACAHLP